MIKDATTECWPFAPGSWNIDQHAVAALLIMEQRPTFGYCFLIMKPLAKPPLRCCTFDPEQRPTFGCCFLFGHGRNNRKSAFAK
jgi:hypothetical protein